MSAGVHGRRQGVKRGKTGFCHSAAWPQGAPGHRSWLAGPQDSMCCSQQPFQQSPRCTSEHPQSLPVPGVLATGVQGAMALPGGQRGGHCSCQCPEPTDGVWQPPLPAQCSVLKGAALEPQTSAPRQATPFTAGETEAQRCLEPLQGLGLPISLCSCLSDDRDHPCPAQILPT